MENTQPTTIPVPPPPPPPQNIPAAPVPQAKKPSKKFVWLGIAILVVVITVLGFAVYGGKKQSSQTQLPNLSLSVNGQKISEDQLQSTYAYYQKLGLSNDDSLANTKNLYIENAVLTDAFAKSKISAASLNSALTQVKSTSQWSGAPSDFAKVAEQNAAMKNVLAPTIGVKDASGVVFRLGTANTDKKMQSTITSKLNSYRVQFPSKSIEQLEVTFQSDTALKQASLSANVLSFIKMTPSHPIMPGTDFVNASFTTQPKHFSSVFLIPTDTGLYYGMVYVTETTAGQYNNYQQWYSSQLKNVKVEANF